MELVTPKPGVSQLAAQLLARLDRAGQQTIVLPRDSASIDQITGDRAKSLNLLSRMAESGSLRRVRKGAYVVRSRAGTLGVTALQLVGELSPARHMLTAGRALALHSLSDQVHRRMIVQVSRQTSDWAWMGDKVQYAKVLPKSIWGGAPLSQGPPETIVASPPRAILDSLAQPSWGVSLFEVVKALRAALVSARFPDLLASTAARYDNASVSRRLGFLVERLAGPHESDPFLAIRGSSHAIVLLRPGYNVDGPVDPKWGVRQNIDLDLLIEQ
jgi:predicted transcriptional regulator of viral defense system